MVYKRPRVKQNQYNKIIPLDSSNPDELRHFDELMASHDAYMKECDEIDAYWENHPLSKMGKEVRAVYDNAKKRWNQFEEAHPYAATGVKIGACVAGAALIIGAVKSLADVIDDDDSGSHDSLNVAADSDDMVMRSRAEAGPEYNIEQITNNTVDDSHPMMDSTGVYWLEGNGPYSLWYEDNAGNEKEIAKGLNNDGWHYTAENGKVITIESGKLVVITNSGERTDIVNDIPGPYQLTESDISGEHIVYTTTNVDDSTETLYLNNVGGNNEKLIASGDIRSPNIDGNEISYIEKNEDGKFILKCYDIQTEIWTNQTLFDYMSSLHVKNGKAVFLGSDDGEHWAVYLQEDMRNPDSVSKIRDVQDGSADLFIGNKMITIGEPDGEDYIFDLEKKELVDVSELGVLFRAYEDSLVYVALDNQGDNEIYKTDLSIKEPEPTNTAPSILTDKGEINGKGIEVLVEDPEGDDVTLASLDSDYKFKGNELLYNSEIPEDNLTEIVKIKATDSKGAYTEKSLEVTVIGKGKEPIIDPNPDPNPDPVDPVPNGNSSESGGGFWGKYMIPIIGGAAVAATTVGAAVTGFIGYKRKKGKEKGKRPVATYPNEISSRRGAPAYTTAQNVQKAAEA